MNLRSAVSVLAVAAALTACSSSSNGGSPSVANSAPAPGGGGTTAAVVSGGGSSGDFCANLATANSKLNSLGSSASAGDFNALKTAIGQDISVFQSLGNGAPAQVKPAIDDIITGLQSAQSALSDPSHPDSAKLSALATKLPADITKLSAYISANCH